MTEIDGRSSAEEIAAVLGKHVDVYFDTVASSAPQFTAGNFRGLAVTAAERIGEFPDVPTLMESGYDIEFSGLRGIFAPLGVPKERLKIIEGIFKKTMEDEGIQKLFQKLKLKYAPLPAEEFKKTITRYVEQLRPIAEGIKAGK